MNSKNTTFQHQKKSGVNRGFKSPLISRTSEQGQATGDRALSSALPVMGQSTQSSRCNSIGAGEDEQRLKQDIDRLREELEETDKQIQQLRESGIEESELAEYINKLHEYNDLKDIGQMVIGSIANIEGVRTKDLYPKYGLELDD